MAAILNCYFEAFLQKSQRGNKQIRVQQVQIYENGYITNFYPKMPPSVHFSENGPSLTPPWLCGKDNYLSGCDWTGP